MQNLKQLLESNKGKFFTVEFVKKNGELRKLNGRLKVTKHLKGGISKNTNPDHVIVYDIVNKGYRTINLNTVKSIKQGKTEYKVINGNLYTLVR